MIVIIIAIVIVGGVIGLTALYIDNKTLKKTQWYLSLFVDPQHEIYPDNEWYRKHDERNFDLVNLGSSGGKWAFDYSGFNIKAMNWAQQPQTLLEDYNLLRHFHSILRKGGYVIITIMPFTGLNKETNLYDALKFARFDIQGEPIQPYLFREARRISRFPILLGKVAIKAFVKFLIGRDKPSNIKEETKMNNNPMTLSELDKDAKRWIDGWKRQFGIDDFEAPLTPKNMSGREYRVNLMRQLVDFCAERGYKPVYVIPPVTKHLDKYFTSKFQKLYIYDFLQQVDRYVQTLDYSKDVELKEDDLYFNSFFLNARGRKLFTAKVLEDLNII